MLGVASIATLPELLLFMEALSLPILAEELVLLLADAELGVLAAMLVLAVLLPDAALLTVSEALVSALPALFSAISTAFVVVSLFALFWSLVEGVLTPLWVLASGEAFWAKPGVARAAIPASSAAVNIVCVIFMSNLLVAALPAPMVLRR
jgi:hypothetical protein